MDRKILDQDKQKETVLSIVLIGLLIYFLSNESLVVYIAFGIGILSLLSERFTQIVSKIWHFLLRILAFINSHILLGTIFYVVLFPLSLIYRLLNRKTLSIANKKDSYFEQRNHKYVSSDLENPW